MLVAADGAEYRRRGGVGGALSGRSAAVLVACLGRDCLLLVARSCQESVLGWWSLLKSVDLVDAYSACERLAARKSVLVFGKQRWVWREQAPPVKSQLL